MNNPTHFFLDQNGNPSRDFLTIDPITGLATLSTNNSSGNRGSTVLAPLSAAQVAVNATAGVIALDAQGNGYNAAGAVAFGPAAPSLNVATHTAAIDARLLPNGAITTATCGVLHAIAGAGASYVTVSNGAITMPAAGNSCYIALQCDDTVQYMRAIVYWPSDCTGVATLVIPWKNGSFPGVGGAGNPDAAVHASVTCYNGTSNDTSVASGSYGSDLSIGPFITPSLYTNFPLQGNTRTMECFFQKATGRVTIALDGQVVLDYFNATAINYAGPYGIFEISTSSYGDQNTPQFIAIEASSQYRAPGNFSLARLSSIYPASAISLTNSYQSISGWTVPNSKIPGGANLVIVSVFVSQTSGDTYLRLTDGTDYTGNQVIARGAFTGRVTYIETINSTAGDLPLQLQAYNTAGVGTLTAGSDTGYHHMLSLGMPLPGLQ